MSDNKLQVFISWSQEPAKQIAGCVRNLLEKIFPDQNINFFLSTCDISAGENFVDILDKNLAQSCFGILILTKNNFAKEWLMYEAGALAKGTKEKKTKPKLCPILFTREKEQIESPLKSFQHTIFEEASFLTLIRSIKQSIFKTKSLNNIQEEQLKDNLNKEWSNFERKVSQIIQEHTENHPDDNITKITTENVGRLMMDEEAYDEILSKRDSHLKELIGNLSNDSSERIIIFGGISTILREESAIIELAIWVVKNQTSKLFICHESSEVVIERVQCLPLNVYDTDTNRDEEVHEHTNRDEEAHERKIIAFKKMKDTLLGNIGIALQKNVTFIEITKPTTLYATIQGDLMYLTPLLDKRSSNTFTIKLKGTKYIEEILLYLRSIIRDNDENGHLLVDEIDLIIKNRPIDKEGDKKHGK